MSSIVTPGDRPSQSQILGDNQRRIRNLEAVIAAAPSSDLITTNGSLTVNPTTTLEIGDGLTLTNPSPNDATVSLAAFVNGLETFSVSSTTVTSGTQSSMSMAHVAGGTLLDYTTPTLPVPVDTATYGLAITAKCATIITAGAAVSITIIINSLASTIAQTFASNTIGATDGNNVTVSIVSRILTSESIEIRVRNEDSISHNITVDGFFSRIL